jgi:hypothetical protein
MEFHGRELNSKPVSQRAIRTDARPGTADDLEESKLGI